MKRSWIYDKANREAVVALAREVPPLDQREIGIRLGISQSLVGIALRAVLSREEHRQVISRSRSHKKSAERHPLWRGIEVGLHRCKFERQLGFKLPTRICVHHLDEDKTNDSRSNLSLVTKSGHLRVHTLTKTPHGNLGVFIDHELETTKVGLPVCSAAAKIRLERDLQESLPDWIVVAHLNGDTEDLNLRNLIGLSRIGLRHLRRRILTCES